MQVLERPAAEIACPQVLYSPAMKALGYGPLLYIALTVATPNEPRKTIYLTEI